MQLSSFLTQQNISLSAAAQRLKVSHEAVRCWANLSKIPGRESMVEIYVWTQGQVTPNDFYQLPELTSASAPAAGDDRHVVSPPLYSRFTNREMAA